MIDKKIRAAAIDRIETAIETAVNDFSLYGYNGETWRNVYKLFSAAFRNNEITVDDFSRYREIFHCITIGG